MKQIYFLISFLFFVYSWAQNYTAKWYGMDNGLPQNSIKDIIKDKYGFMWMTTEAGIVRYDGNTFTLYNNFKLKNLYLGDFAGNYKKDSILIFNESDREAISISARKPKEILTSPEARNSFSLHKKVYKRYYKNNLTRTFYYNINYYYTTTKYGAYYFDNQHIEYRTQREKPGKILKNNFHHKDLNHAFMHHDSLYITDPLKRQTMLFYKGTVTYDNTPSIYNDPKSKIYWHQITGQVFIINNGDIYRSEIVNGKPELTFLLHYKEIDKQFVGSIFHDKRANKLYLGSPIMGLNILNLSDFTISKKNIPYFHEVCYAAVPFSKSSVVTDEGIEYFSNKTNTIYPLNLSEDKRYLFYDDSQNLVYRKNNSVFKRFRSSGYKKSDSVSFLNKKIEGLFKTDKIYAASMSDTDLHYYLYIFEDDSFKKIRYILPFSESINTVYHLGNDLLYVGCTKGLYLVSMTKNKVIRVLSKELGVKQIFKTKDNNLWVTTYKSGFYLVKNDRLIKMPEDKNNFISSAHYILEDNHSNYWISSNNGLFKVHKKLLMDYARSRKNTVTYYRYTKENGFSNNEFNGTGYPGANVLEDGQFVFPSMEGFVFFQPEKLKNYYPKPGQIFIERAVINQKMISFTDKLFLKNDFKAAEIYIDIPYYSNIENIYLQARLEKGNSAGPWLNIRKDKKFIISNIEPGNYNVSVRYLVSEDGKFAYKNIPVEIEIYFYQTIIFKALVLLAGLGVIIFIFRLRTKFLRFKNRTLETRLQSQKMQLKETHTNLELTRKKLKNESEYQKKLIEAISHDITTPVKFIALLSQELSESKDILSQKEYFDTIYKTSEQLYKFTLGLKEYTELYKEEKASGPVYQIDDLIESKKLLFQEIALRRNTRMQSYSEKEIRTNVNRNILAAIIHNIIDNAVKNTSSGEITITTNIIDEQVEIRIADTGSGMSDEQIHYYSQVFETKTPEELAFKKYGLGLHMVIQLVQKINAAIIFEKNNPTGTIVKIFINYEH